MQIKKVISGDEARKVMYSGFKVVADTVANTAGPSGRNIAIQESWSGPKVTKDGVTVAKSITLSDGEGEGAKLMVQAAEKTNKNAGDGTTATCIIAKAIAEEGLKQISYGRKSTEIKKGIDYAIKEAVEYLKSHSKSIQTNDEVKQVATVSANNDTEIGDMIATAVDKIGRDGVITVEEARGLTTELEIVDGLQFDQGYLSPYFMTNPERQLVEFDNPFIFLYDGKIISMQSMVNLLEPVAQSGRPIVIIADEVENEPLTALVVNHMKGGLKCCAVKAPSFGDIRKFIMEDIASMTGGQFISTQLGLRMEDLTPECLGTCAKIKITPTDTTIVSNNDDETKERIRARVTQLREELENTESSYDKMKLRERIAKLLSGIAVIKVGGATEVEVKERKDRVDDAVNATKAALEEGILPGGGVSLARFTKGNISLPEGADSDFITGVNIVRQSLSSQLKTIAENAGKSADVVLEKVLENDNFNFGYNARTDEYCDLVEAGILDATKVVRCAIENGASVAGQLLTVEGLVIDDIDANAKIMSMYQRQPQM